MKNFVKHGVDIAPQSRDAILSALAFLCILQDKCGDWETKQRIQKTINELSDMAYGHDEEKNIANT